MSLEEQTQNLVLGRGGEMVGGGSLSFFWYNVSLSSDGDL